jgi:putative flippase GtrA
MSRARSGDRRRTLRRFVRYGSVSAISTVTGLSILGLLVGVLSFPALWANFIATALGTVPSFELNRRWVWSHHAKRSVKRQVVPYSAIALAGLVVSSVSVHLAADLTEHWSRLVHTVAVLIANLASYGALWFLQFVVCDRVLFRPADQGEKVSAGSNVDHSGSDEASRTVSACAPKRPSAALDRTAPAPSNPPLLPASNPSP